MIEALLELRDVLSRNALRTVLTGLSVAWGMFMLVVLLGAGSGLENGAAWEFRDDAQNSIWISGGTGRDGRERRDAPKIGWCWARNRHTWLGFASASGRAPAV